MARRDVAVARECWASAIPVQLRLAESELSSLEAPPTLYALVPRQSYLHSLVPAALRALQHLLPPGEDVPWFEHGRLPLKWNVPAGVLYDLVAAPSGELPWRLTIHFRGFPTQMLPQYCGEPALRGAFFSSLKEAAVVCRGSAQRVMEMAAGAQEDLFRQALESSLDRYQAILASLQLAPAGQRGAPPRLPLRLYLRTDAGGYLSSYEDISSTSRPVAALAQDGSPISLRQALLPLVEDFVRHHTSSGGGGGSNSLAALPAAPASPMSASSAGALQSLPGTPVARNSSMAVDGGGGGSGGDGGTLAAVASTDAELPAAFEAPARQLGATLGDEASSREAAAGVPAADDPIAASAVGQLPPAAAEAVAAPSVEASGAGEPAAAALLDQAAADKGVLVAGTCPPLETPLAWLHAQLHAPDFFLYVVLHLPLPR